MIVRDYERGIPAGSRFKELELEAGERKEDNLTTSLYYSYEELDIEDKARFRALGVLAYDQPFDAALLGALWQLPIENVSRYANRLRLLSLLEIDGGAFRQHSLLRAYASALLEDAGELILYSTAMSTMS